MDELFDISTLIQTEKKTYMPVILFGKDFWGGLVDWIKTTMLENGVINKDDLKILHLIDTTEEVIDIIQRDDTVYYVFENGHELPMLCFCCGDPLNYQDLEQALLIYSEKDLLRFEVGSDEPEVQVLSLGLVLEEHT